MGNTFENRAGRPGYDEKGSALSGMAGSQARDEYRRRVQGEKNVIRMAEKNARNALKSGDMKSWEEWSRVAGGTTSGIPNADQVTRNAEARVFRNTNDAANLRPAGAPPNGQPVAGQPNAQGAQADGVNVPNGQVEAGGVNAPKVTTEKSTREALAGKSLTPDYSQDFQNRRNEADTLKEQYLSGAMSEAEFREKGMAIKGSTQESLDKIINENNNANNRRDEASVLKEQYSSGAMSKEEFLEKGKAIGGTDKSLGAITAEVEKANSNALADRDRQNKISDANKMEIFQNQGTGGLESRDPNYNPNDPKYAQAKAEREARDALEKTNFDKSQAEFKSKMDASRNTAADIQAAKDVLDSKDSTPEERAKAKASLNKINDTYLAKGNESDAIEAQNRLSFTDYEKDALNALKSEQNKFNAESAKRDASTLGARRSIAAKETNEFREGLKAVIDDIKANREAARAERDFIRQSKNTSTNFWL